MEVGRWGGHGTEVVRRWGGRQDDRVQDRPAEGGESRTTTKKPPVCMEGVGKRTVVEESRGGERD